MYSDKTHCIIKLNSIECIAVIKQLEPQKLFNALIKFKFNSSPARFDFGTRGFLISGNNIAITLQLF